MQYAFADMLEADSDIVEIRCNVQLEGMDYTSDFLCVKANGEYMVRECVYRKLLTKPMTMKMLESSRQYWMDENYGNVQLCSICRRKILF